MTTAQKLSLAAANDANAETDIAIAITGLVGLLARSQARRIAKKSDPANATTAPSARSAQS